MKMSFRLKKANQTMKQSFEHSTLSIFIQMKKFVSVCLAVATLMFVMLMMHGSELKLHLEI